MKDSSTAADNEIPFCSGVESKTRAWIEIVIIVIESFLWPGFEFVSQTQRRCKTISKAKLILNKEPIVAVIHCPFSLIANCVRDAMVEVR